MPWRSRKSNGIGPERFEFQMLYGVRRDLHERLVAQGQTVRIYVPYGSQWYPYYMRRLGERPQNVISILVSVLNEGRGKQALTHAARGANTTPHVVRSTPLAIVVPHQQHLCTDIKLPSDQPVVLALHRHSAATRIFR